MWRWFSSLVVVVSVGIGGRAAAAVALTPPQIAVGGVGQGASGEASASLTSDTMLVVTLRLGTTGDCPQFAITTPTSLVIGPTASTVTVRMTPTSSGAKRCSLNVQQGAVTLASFEVNGAGIFPELALDRPVVDVGNVEIFQTGGASVTVSNIGTAPLFISDLEFLSGQPTFSAVGRGGTLAPGASTTIGFQCAPLQQGRITGTFRITSNTPGSFTNIPLICTGTIGSLLPDPTSVDFGTVLRGATKLRTFTLKNVGNLPVDTIAAQIIGRGTGYAFDGLTLPAALAPGESKLLTIAFSPATASDGGTATLEITGDWGSVPRRTIAHVTLNARATNAGFHATPSPLDFGEFVFDAAPERTFEIKNVGDTTIAIQSMFFTPDAGTAPSEVRSTIRRGGPAVSLPQTLAPGERLDVTVTAVPNDRTGVVSGHIDVQSNIPGAAAERVELSGTATAATFTAPAVVDFGAVDLRGAAPPQIVAMRNTGTAELTISSIAVAVGSSAAFTATLPAAAVRLAPGVALSIPVSYRPTQVQLPGVFENMILVVGIAGTLDGPRQTMIAVRGRGIDGALQIEGTAAFPPTHRYPGTHAPERPVTVHNAGEAPVVITAVMLDGAPVWQLVNAGAVTIPGGGRHDFVIRFSPTEIGAARDGRLTLVSDDRALPTATVALTGVGTSRSVAFDTTRLDLGSADVGASLTAMVTIRNLDAANAVTIREIAMDDAAFSIPSAVATQIDAGGSKTYMLQFAPTATGELQAQATLYLDEDPDPQATAMFIGRGRPSDPRQPPGPPGAPGAPEPSGGCSAGGDGGVALLGAIGLLVLGPRRRRLSAAT